MEDQLAVAPDSQKRPRDDDAPSTPVKAINSEASTPLSVLSNVQTPSPMQVIAHSTPASATQPSTQTAPDSSSAQQSRKKRKVLTQQEKDDAAREKEAKARAKADKAAQKEAEARLKADEKAQKAALKEAESKTKSEEKATKDAEKREKEEEKAKNMPKLNMPEKVELSVEEGKALFKVRSPIIPQGLRITIHLDATARERYQPFASLGSLSSQLYQRPKIRPPPIRRLSQGSL